MKSDVARMLHDSAERLLAQLTPVPPSDPAWAERLPDLAAGQVELGVPLALVPETSGGLGLAWADIAVLPRLWGRWGVPAPIVEPLLAARIAAACRLDSSWQSASVAVAEDGVIDAAWWPGASGLLLIEGEAIRGFRDAEFAGEDLAGQPRARPVSTTPSFTAEMDGIAELRAGARLLAAAAMLGAMEQARDQAIDYARIRVQFGKPLGQFQAIQRLLMQIASEVEAVRAVLNIALERLDTGDDRPLFADIAKVRAGRAATIIAAHAHQVLGAVGFTEEHALHRSTKRLWSWRDDWGREASCAETIGRIVAATGGNGLWPLLTR